MIDREQWEIIKRQESELNLAVLIFFIGLATLIIFGFFVADFLIGILK